MNTQKALHQFWSGFTLNGNAVKAYPSGQVPAGAAFPNVTYSVPFGAPFATLYATAFIWLQEQNGANYNQLRQDFFDAVRGKIPPEGVLLPAADGYMLLTRADDFLSLYNTGEAVDGRPVYGGKVSYKIQFLTR